MRKTFAIAFALFVSITSLPASGADTPISGHFTTIGYNTVDQTTVFVSGTGTTTLLGQASTLLQGRIYNFAQPPNGPPTASYDSVFMEITAPDGSGLTMQFTGATITFTSQTSLVFSGPVVVLGGTGSLAGATGSMPFSGSFQFTGPQNGFGEVSFAGTLTTSSAVFTSTLPALVESPSYQTELVAENHSASKATVSLTYRESNAPGDGSGTVAFDVSPGAQVLIPNLIDYLRTHGVPLAPKGSATFAGAARVRVTGATSTDVSLGARILASAGTGSYGVFVPAVAAGDDVEAAAALDGLRDDASSRSNVAVIHTGADGSGSLTLHLQVYDADASGAAKGTPEVVVLDPGQWRQLNKLLTLKGVQRGWVVITRAAGSAPWTGYATINDGANPGQGTGDGSTISLTRLP